MEFDQLWPLKPFLDWGGNLLQDLRPNWPTERPISSNPPSWYITPRFSFGEFVFWHVLFISLAYALYKGPGLKPLDLPKGGKRKVGIADWLMGGLVLVCLLITAWYKVETQTIVYLSQPCHVVCLLLVYFCWTTDVRKGAIAFTFFVHMNLGTFLALTWPDTSDYIRRNIWPKTAISNFFILHWALALIPLIYEWRGVYRWRPGPYAMLIGWIALGFLHWSVLFPLSVASEQNINYMLSPPNKGPLLKFGQWYRFCQCLAVYPLLIVPGYIMPKLISLLKWILSLATGKGAKSSKSKPSTPRKASTRPSTPRKASAKPSTPRKASPRAPKSPRSRK